VPESDRIPRSFASGLGTGLGMTGSQADTLPGICRGRSPARLSSW
jgi:hypothetical protein